MNHYRQCRETRARRRRQRVPQQTNACLICTLLARHDKSISESSLAITSPLPPTPQKTRTNQTHSLASSFDKIYSPQVNRRKGKARSKSVHFESNREAKICDSPAAMPPPPPRSRTSSIGSMSSIGSISCYDEHFASGRTYRPRAESLDERKMPSPTFDNDPTVEIELRSPNSDETIELRKVQRQLPFRKRSMSCSIIPNEKNTKGCDTIMEE